MNAADFYQKVPKDRDENLSYRLELRRRCAKDPKVRKAVVSACRDDILYFFNSLCFLYEPRPMFVEVGGVRKKLPMVIPFITWPHQDKAIREICEHLGELDCGVEKSRGEGMSWIAVLIAIHHWLFIDNSKIGFVSRTERAADDPEDPDSLLWKAVWELGKLPEWMAGKKDVHWKRNVANHTLVNLRNGSRINAGAATGDVFRGGRLTWALMDEFAFFKKGEDADALNSSHGATNSRLFVSTVNGTNNEYYRIMHEPSNMVKVVIDWTKNVSRNRGLYQFRKGLPVAVDPENNPLPPEYDPPSEEVLSLFARLRRKGFKLEGQRGEDPPYRSPWYDRECDRAGMTPQRIAQELDRDYSGSEYLVFGNEFNGHVQKQVSEPIHVGKFDLLEDTSEGELQYNVMFDTVFDGSVKLWMPLDVRGRPPRSMYALGADVSTGLGGSYTSNSTLIGMDLITREQVLAFASNTIEPSDFADLATGIARWLWGAYLGWEHNGPGAAFTKRMLKTGYGHVYRRKSQSKSSKRETKEMGWWTDERTKPAMFSEISRAVQKGDAVVRDEALAREFKQYVYLNGKIEHSASLTTEDSSSRGKAHGDRVIAFGVVLQCALDRPGLYQGLKDLGGGETREPPIGTMAHRMRIYAEEDSKRDADEWQKSVLERIR